MRTYTVTIKRVPLGMNRRERTHWARRHNELQEICTELGWALIAAKVPRIRDVSRADSKRARRRVTIHITKPTRGGRDDRPNREARAKSILDSLVALGYLVDDSERWLEWGGVTESKGPEGPLTTIEIGDPIAA